MKKLLDYIIFYLTSFCIWKELGIKYYICLISVWGKVETINVKTAEEASNVLSHLIYRRTKNLNEYELKVGYFNQGQTLAKPIKVQSNMYHEHADIFKGFDEIMLKTIAGNMNFKMEHVHPRDNKWYGYGLPNGTYVGAIGNDIWN